MLNSFAEESHECVDECLVVRGAKTCRRCATNGKQLDFGNPRHGPRACHILVADTMIGVVISRFALADASRFVKGELPAGSYLSDSVEIGVHMRELFRIASCENQYRLLRYGIQSISELGRVARFHLGRVQDFGGKRLATASFCISKPIAASRPEDHRQTAYQNHRKCKCSRNTPCRIIT